MALKVSPDAERKPLLPDGEYGLGGEAVLNKIVARGVPTKQADGKWEPSTTEFYIDFGVQVDDPTEGRVFVNSSPFGKFNTCMGDNTGSAAPLWLANLGMNVSTIEFTDEPDDKGNHALLGADPCPLKVVVNVALEKRKDGTQANGMKGLALLG